MYHTPGHDKIQLNTDNTRNGDDDDTSVDNASNDILMEHVCVDINDDQPQDCVDGQNSNDIV